MESNVRSRVAVVAATLRGVVDGGLFEDHVATAATLRRVRADLTRLIVELEKGPTKEVTVASVGVGEPCAGA